MKIKSIKKRRCVIEDFLQNKKYSPWSKYRKTAKSINFSLLFGCGAPTFARLLRNKGFSEADCDDAIASLELQDALNRMILDPKQQMPLLDKKYLVCAIRFRDMFFKTYPGLMTRIEREQEYAIKKGYVRACYGPVRHFPELRYMKFNKDGELIGGDKKLHNKLLAGLKNTACNTSIQTMEAYHAFLSWNVVQRNLENWGFKTRIWNGTHDSFDIMLYAPEKDAVLALLREVTYEEKNPKVGLPLNMDADISDMTTSVKLKSNYYKHGSEEISLDRLGYTLQEALDKYNEKNGTSCTYTKTF